MRSPRRPLSSVAAAAVTALALAFPPIAAAAGGDVTFTPDPVLAGRQVSTTVSAEGVGSRSSPCQVSIDGIAVIPACVQLDATTASVTFTVPAETAAGSRTVTLSVSRSTFTGSLVVMRLVPVPELRPLPRDRALAAVEKAGLQLCATRQDGGYVVDQSPAPGSEAPEGSCVTVTLKDGVVVPDLQSLDRSRARAALEQLFLILHAPAGDGLIAGQDPQAGTTVPPGTVVSVTFAVPPPTSPATSPPVPTQAGEGAASADPGHHCAGHSARHPGRHRGRNSGRHSAGRPHIPARDADHLDLRTGAGPWPLGLGVLAFLAGLAATSYVMGRARARRGGGGKPKHDERQPGRKPEPVVAVRPRPDHRVRPHLLDDKTLDGARIGVVVRDDAGAEPVLLEELP